MGQSLAVRRRWKQQLPETLQLALLGRLSGAAAGAAGGGTGLVRKRGEVAVRGTRKTGGVINHDAAGATSFSGGRQRRGAGADGAAGDIEDKHTSVALTVITVGEEAEVEDTDKKIVVRALGDLRNW